MAEPLRIEQPSGDAGLEDWRRAHNEIIPTHVLSLDDVRERAQRNHLAVAYVGDVLVGCSTVRPPGSSSEDGDATVTTVIVRVLPAYRGQGFGAQLYASALAVAHSLGATVVETVVLASNPDGLRFAERHGFVETERYVLPGDTIPYITLRMSGES